MYLNNQRIEEMKKDKISHYTYHTSATRPIKIVLKGLPEMADEHLTGALQSLSIHPTQIKIL